MFSTVWLKIREREIRDDNFEIKYYQTYFFQALRRTKIKEEEKQRRNCELMIDPADQSSDDKWETELDILETWLHQSSPDDYDRFLKDIIYLVIHSKTIDEAAERAGISRRLFINYYKEARNEIAYEHFKFVDRDTFHLLPLV